MGCARHPYEGTVGVCASCVSDRLNKEALSSDRGRFAKTSSVSEEHFLWKEGASTSSSISKHGLIKGGRIVDTIASLIKTDYAIPTNYEGPRGRDRSHRDRDRYRDRDRELSTRSYASVEQRVFDSSQSHGKAMAVAVAMPANANATDDDRDRFSRDGNKVNGKSKGGGGRGGSRERCEISAAEPPEGQTIHSLMDAEPKSGKFSRSTSKGSPASYFSRSGSKRQSWTVFWRSDKKDDFASGGRAGGAGGEVLRSVSDGSRPLFNSVDTSDLRSRRYSDSSTRSNLNNHHGGRSSRREDLSSVEEGCKRLADYVDRDSMEHHQQRKASAAAASHSYERNRSWEQLGLAKLPFASVYAAPASNSGKNYSHKDKHNHESRKGNGNGNGVAEPRRNHLWKMGRKKSNKGESKAADHRHSLTSAAPVSAVDEDLGQSSGRPTPCTNSCFPQSSGGRHNIGGILRREDAHVSHEKLRHRRLSIYSYGIMSQPQLTPGLDSQLSGGGRSRAVRPYMYNGQQRDFKESSSHSYFPNGRIAVDYWDGDESMSPCDHYVEVANRGDGGVVIIDFIPVSEAQNKAYDWVERSKIEGKRSPPSWIDRGNGRGQPMELEHGEHDDDDDSLASGSADINFLGKEELTTVFEQDSESGYGGELGRRTGEEDDDYRRSMDSPTNSSSRPYPANRKSRLAKGKSIITEIEDEVDDPRIEQRNGGETLLSVRSLSDTGSYARESTDSEIVPARSSLRSLFYMDREEADGHGHGHREDLHEIEGRAYKPDNAYDAVDMGDWTPDAESANADHKDGLTNHSASTKRSPWKNFTMSPSMRRKFLWPRSSPQPHIRRSGDAGGMFGSGHHHTRSFSDTDSQKALRPRSPTSTNENTTSSSNVMAPEGEGPLALGLAGVLSEILQDEVTNGTSDTGLTLVEVDESSHKSSPQKSSLSRSSSQQRASLSRSSSKSPQRTLSRNSSRRSRSSSWSSCLTDPQAWSAQTVPSKKGENGSHEKEGPLSSLIRLGKKLSRRSSPANPWHSFSKGSPQRGEETR